MANDNNSKLPESKVTETTVSVDALKSSLKSESSPNSESKESKPVKAKVKEVGGRGGLDPTRYGDWEKGGRCIDF